jgi:hypothetical protein
MNHRPLIALGLAAACCWCGAARAQAPDPAGFQREIEGYHLEPARAVAVKGVKLAAGPPSGSTTE